MIKSSMNRTRAPYTVAFSVWKALFLREAMHRLSTRRFGVVWLLLEPVASIAFMIFVFTVIRLRVISGIDTAIWLMSGLLTFSTFRHMATQSMNAVNSNKTLFAYRQVKPVDTVLVRASLEGFLAILVGIILFGSAALYGLNIIPDDLMLVMEAILGVGLLGLGFGLMVSVIIHLVPEAANIVSIIMMPLNLISGTIFPLFMIPQAYREWLMLNPVAHGIEAIRVGFSSYYHAVPELSINYMYGCALVMIFFGLMLHIRFQTRLITQ